MSQSYFFIFLTFILSALIGWLAIPRIVIMSKKKRLFDQINERKSHSGTIPRLGGVTFFPGTLLSFALVLGLSFFYGSDLGIDSESRLFSEFLFVISGSVLLFFIGLMDDLVGISYGKKLITQIFAGMTLVYSGVAIDNLGGLFGVYHVPIEVGTILTVLLVVFIVNAFNFIDGVDGLCSSLGILALSTLGIWFLISHFFVYAMMAFGMIGVVLMFLMYNVLGDRLKIFMGDTGSLTLGFFVIFLGLKFYSLNIHSFEYVVDAAPAVLLGIIFVPAFDAVRVVVSRIHAGLSPFNPDKRHIHHKFIQLGFSHLQCTAVIVLIQTGFIVLNILFDHVNVNILLALNILAGLLINIILNQAIKARQAVNIANPAEINAMQ